MDKSKIEWTDATWNTINAKRGYSWKSNPWVWVIEFEVIQKNIDQVLKGLAI